MKITDPILIGDAESPNRKAAKFLAAHYDGEKLTRGQFLIGEMDWDTNCWIVSIFVGLAARQEISLPLLREGL